MRRPGIGLLAGVVTGIWLLLVLFTQFVSEPPLDPTMTIIAGVLLTNACIFGFASGLRGPRTAPWRGGAFSHPSDRGEQRTIAVLGRGLPYLRHGLTVENARRTAHLVRPLLSAHAVGLADREQVLALNGDGVDHHRPGDPLDIHTRQALRTGRSVTVRSGRLTCMTRNCPLETATIAPLIVNGDGVGALQVYRIDDHLPPRGLVEGMAGILSMHLELATLDRQRQLAADAQLSALRAQINPHFLFNTLNTIASKARTDPDEARELLLRLSDFFRYAVRQDGHFAEFSQEYFFVRTYLSLEQARFGERLRVRYDIDPQVLGASVPVLVIQPLVENAVKHGLADKVGGGSVTLKARVDPLGGSVNIQVRDDGIGIPPERLKEALNENGRGSGIGLSNINERLATLFGERYRMEIDSRPGRGTTVHLDVPVRH